MFSHVAGSFSQISTKNYTQFVHETSRIKPSKYDSTSGTKIYIMFDKNRRDEIVDRNKHL